MDAIEEEDIADFKYFNWNDQIYREYDSLRPESFSASWKTGRPTVLRSWRRCIFYSFILTVICGAAMSAVATFLFWLDLNLDTACYDISWYEMPKNIQLIRLTSEVAKGMTIQCWHLFTMFFVFGWDLVKKANLLPWTILASSTDAMFRLFINVYRTYDRWRLFPLNALFASTAIFSSYQIASQFRQKTGQRIQLAAILGAQFYLGIPVAVIFNGVIVPHFKHISNSSKALLASLCPTLLIIPKAVARVCARNTRGINHPGTSVLLVVALHAGPPTLFRILQAKVEEFRMYVILCFVHGLESTFDKITLPIQDFILQWFYERRCCKRKQITGHLKPRASRLQADLAIMSVIAESTAIFVSSAGLQIFRYYYARDDRGERYDATKLLEIFCLQAGVAIVIETLFNALAIKIQTYFYNIPIIRVWKINKRWILGMFLVQHFMGLLVFGNHIYSATRTKSMFDQNITQQCFEPFYRA